MTQNENNSEYPIYFTREEIEEYADSLSGYEKKMDYLLFAVNKVCIEREEYVSLPEFQGANYVAIQNDVRQLEGLNNQLISEVSTLEKREIIKQSSKDKSDPKKQKTIKPIRWRMEKTILCYLFDFLKNEGFIATSTLGKTISDHFLDQEDKPIPNHIANQTLSNVRNGISGKFEDVESLEEIMVKLKEIEKKKDPFAYDPKIPIR